MIKVLIGGKGSGKTKTLIELTNNAANTSNGSVICIEKGDTLTHEITYKARLVDSDFHLINSAEAFFGFVAGILASNNDITDIYVDSALKICANDVDGLVAILPKLEKLAKDVNLVLSVSIPVEEAPAELKALV